MGEGGLPESGEDGDMELLTGSKTYSSPLCMFCAVDSAHLYRMSGVVADIHPLCSIICYSSRMLEALCSGGSGRRFRQRMAALTAPACDADSHIHRIPCPIRHVVAISGAYAIAVWEGARYKL